MQVKHHELIIEPKLQKKKSTRLLGIFTQMILDYLS